MLNTCLKPIVHPYTYRFDIALKWQRVRESNPFLKFRDATQFRHKSAVGCALTAKMQISQFARFAQNYAVSVSEIVRKLFSETTHTAQHRLSADSFVDSAQTLLKRWLVIS
jgi:hypothetical protein